MKRYHTFLDREIRCEKLSIPLNIQLILHDSHQITNIFSPEGGQIDY